jgi:predicted transcriptional regulator
MAQDVELSSFDLRYESYRMKNRALEARLLASIAERGVDEPLEGVEAGEQKILLNGFKRFRCARRLGIGHVPYVSLGDDEAAGILGLIRASNAKSLGILEQARFIDDLRTVHKMSVADIAEIVSRSKAWVSMRLGLNGEMSDRIRQKLFSGAFPVYGYMYTVRQFMRMNGVRKQEVEDFVEAVSGKKLSVRDIERLAHGYFRGPDWFREEIRNGNLALPLERMRQVPEDPQGCNEFERVLLKDLEIVAKYMQRVTTKSQDKRLKTRAFSAQANLLAAGILSRLSAFTQALRELHDRTGAA